MQNDALPMRDKVCIVTGANSGLGFVTARELARMGATVVMICRDRERGEAARSAISTATGSERVSLLLADLAVQDSVRQVADTILQNFEQIHVLVNNAGLVMGQRQLTPDGIEYTFAVNHLAAFLLTNRLLDKITRSVPARIVNVTSEAQTAGTIDFTDLMGERRYTTMRAYSQSKLANILFTYELARRVAGTGVTVNCVHPGAVRTNFALNTGGLFGIVARLVRPFELSPERGAATIVYLASSPDVAGVSGQYFSNKRPKKSSKESYDRAVAARLWQVSEELTQSGRALAETAARDTEGG